MGSLTHLESRAAKVSYSPEEVYNFISDISNFRRFIPSGSFSDIDFKHDSCSFNVNNIGTVTVQLKEKILHKKVVFAGNALLQNDFTITLFLEETSGKQSEIKVAFEAEMNPFLKMAAAEPLNNFLETLVNEIEKFEGWNDISQHNQPL